MNPTTMQTLKRLEATHGRNLQTSRQPRLKVFYGWSKINKIQKREAITVMFENEELAGSDTRRSGKTLKKQMEVCYERDQTPEEVMDAKQSNRVFTTYYVFLDDRHIKGSLKKAICENMKADEKNVSKSILKEIAECLERAYLATHPGYKEPTRQLELDFLPE